MHILYAACGCVAIGISIWVGYGHGYTAGYDAAVAARRDAVQARKGGR